MEIDIEHTKDIAELIAYIVTIISLPGLILSITFSKKQIHFSAMEKCIRDFRDFETSITKLDEFVRAKQYIEIVNEEFFYLEEKYLPLVVSIEWIDGMIDYLPYPSEKR
jgi:hypothetical protein